MSLKYKMEGWILLIFCCLLMISLFIFAIVLLKIAIHENLKAAFFSSVACIITFFAVLLLRNIRDLLNIIQDL